MHDNKQIYFIYFTIENLDVKIRRSQIHLKSMQFEFLSIVKLKNMKIKIKIYHRALKIIFKRILQSEHCNTLINNYYGF